MRKRAMALVAIWALVLSLCGCDPSGTAEGSGSAEPELTYQDYYDLGVRYLSEGNYEEAIIAFTAAIEIDPKWAPAYVGRGDAYVKSGETKSNLAAAKTDYEKAIELDEANAEAYLGLADVYVRQGDYEKALEVLREGLKRTGSRSVEEKLSEVEEIIQGQASPEDGQQGGNASVSFSGTEYDMSLSLTYPGLPEEVWLDNEYSGHSAAFNVSISDGRTTFCVWTTVGGSGDDVPSGMIAVPGDPVCRHVLTVAEANDSPAGHSWPHLRNAVAVSRSGDTLTWSFTMPEGGFPVSDIQYIGYSFFYSLPDVDHRGDHGTFQRQGEQVVYLNDGLVEDLGFLISQEEARRFWEN